MTPFPVGLAAATLLLALSGLALSQPSGTDLDRLLATGGRVAEPDLSRRIATAASHPLGSRQNPVRVEAPAGQRAYLRRLRCPGGASPAFERVGSFGAGPFGSIVDGYRVACPGAPSDALVFMDMYHPGHREPAAPPGFAIAR